MAFPGFSFGGIAATLSSAFRYATNILYGGKGFFTTKPPEELISNRYPDLSTRQVTQVQTNARDANLAGKALGRRDFDTPMSRDVIPVDSNIDPMAAYSYTGTVGLTDPISGVKYFRDVTVLTGRNVGALTVRAAMAEQAQETFRLSPPKNAAGVAVPGIDVGVTSTEILSVFRRT